MTAVILRMSDAVTTVQIHGRMVRVYPGRTIGQADLDAATQSKVFRQWLATLDPAIVINEITIQGFYCRGGKPDPDKVLFIVLGADVEGAYPYTIVLRGPTAVILPILVCEGVEYTIVTKQRRPAVGERYFIEMVAGMTDGEDVISTALKELEQETGLKIHRSQLQRMGDVLEPTPGLVSEPMFFFYVRIPVTPEERDRYEGKLTGEKAEKEEIILQVIPLEQLRITARRDTKAHMAYFMYRELFPLARQSAPPKRSWWRRA